MCRGLRVCVARTTLEILRRACVENINGIHRVFVPSRLGVLLRQTG